MAHMILLLFFCPTIWAGYQILDVIDTLHVINTCYGDSRDIHILDFGDQEIHCGFNEEHYFLERYGYKILTNYSVKSLFQHLGYNHTSVDINGNHGAIVVDCRHDFADQLGKHSYDVILNLGFTEHVGEASVETNLMTSQYTMFKNMHDLGANGSLYYHQLPLANEQKFWALHGVVHYTPQFFRELIEHQNYETIKIQLSDVTFRGNEWTVGSRYWPVVVAAYRKRGDRPFLSYEEFVSLNGLTSIYHQYYMSLDVQLDERKNNIIVDVNMMQEILLPDNVKAIDALGRQACDQITSAKNNKDKYVDCMEQIVSGVIDFRGKLAYGSSHS